MIRESNDTTFRDDVLGAEGLTLVSLWEPASGPSGVQAPFVERFAAARPDVRVVKVNTRRSPRLAGRFGIKELPALLVFKDGQPLVASCGLHHTYAIERLVRAAEARAEAIPQA